MSWGIVAKAAVAVVSGVMQKKAGDSQKRMARKAMKEGNPFGPHREEYATKLKALMDDPTGFLNNPLYKSAFGQGLQAVMRGFAGQGFIGSGNFAAGLQAFGMSTAFGEMKDQERFLAHLAGADISPNAGPGIAGYAAGTDTAGGGIAGIAGGISSFFDNGGFGMFGMGGNTVYPGGGAPMVQQPDYGVTIPQASIPGI